MHPSKLSLELGKTGLLVCDIQSRFAKSIFEFDSIIVNSSKLVEVSKILRIPILVTEQNPNKLGPTAQDLDLSEAKGPFAKSLFSMCIPEVKRNIETLCSGSRPKSLMLAGLEAHACVESTAIDLMSEGYEVHAIADCISSRTAMDRALALQRMRDIGCVIATSESVIWKLIKTSDHENFKQISAILRSPSKTENLMKIY